LKFLDMFGGIGGFRLGIEKATNEKWKCIGYIDIDRYATAVYNYNFKEKHEPTDARAVDFNELPDFSLLCAGFPCQSFSIAGKRKGFEDTRGTLVYEIFRCIRAKKPQIVFLENVKGLLSAQQGYCFFRILQVLDELGYDCQWQVLNSKDFGVPQNRERVFIIGHIRKKSFGKVFPITESPQTDSKPKQNTKLQKQTILANTLRTNYSKGYSNETYIVEGGKSLIELTQGIPDAQRVYSAMGIAKCLKGLGGGQGAKTGLYAIPFDSLHGFGHGWQGYHNRKVLKFGLIRRLTPVECERLQGFPDNWTAKGVTAEGKEIEISDTQRYKMLGNAVTVNVVEAITKRIIDALKECD